MFGLSCHFLCRGCRKHGKLLPGYSINLVNRHVNPGGLGSRNQGVIAVSGDLFDAIWKLHQSNPYRVQLLQLKRAILGLGDVVRSMSRL